MFAHVVDDEITLRLVERHYAPALFALTNRNRCYLRQWLPWVDTTISVDDTRRFIDAALQQWAVSNGAHMTIWYRDELVGAIGQHTINWGHEQTELGYWLGEAFQGRGIITRACRAVVGFSLTDLGLHRVQIRCAVENLRSRAVPERLGFRQEGIIREAMCVNGRFVDLAIYGLLAHEWQPR